MEAVLAEKRRGGRPSRREAAELTEIILDAATDMFLAHGFGATSIDALAATLHISKRTFYHRFRGKEELFDRVVARLIEQWRTSFDAAPASGGTRTAQLRRAARQILDVALSPRALALYRLMIAEASRFPELAAIVQLQAAEATHTRLEPLLVESTPRKRAQYVVEQFLALVLTVPRRRALGLGTPMTTEEREEWVRSSVDLFLNGIGGQARG